MDIVNKTLQHWRRTPFEWGRADCMLSVADYILSVTGLDHAVRFRGRYNDEAGARAAMAAYGGPVALLDYTGLPVLSGPRRGAVAVIDTGTDQVGGICTGTGIALRLERGVFEAEARLLTVLKYWGVE